MNNNQGDQKKLEDYNPTPQNVWELYQIHAQSIK